MNGIWITVSVTVSIFIITHLCLTIWWASRITTLLSVMQERLSSVVSKMENSDLTYVKKEEHAKDLALIQKAQDAAWKKIDHIQEKFLSNKIITEG